MQKNRELLLKGIIQQTKLFQKKEYPSDKDKNMFSIKQEEMIDLISVLGSCSRDKLKKLIELITNQKLPPFPSSGSGMLFIPLAAIVPLSNPNSHNYAIGKVAVAQNTSSTLYRQNGTFGNSMSTLKTSLRPATEKEIQHFVKGLSCHKVKEILRYICIIVS